MVKRANTQGQRAEVIPLYIAAIGVVMLAGAVWRYRQRDMLGMSVCLLMAAFAVLLLVLPARP
ncbi:hypothetical protein X743_28570 [Mesorhizobium sp. LNHC252B00]|nr:hypothetical protein X743_28570 [Mesorhizobium sp. LNHC252B00]